MPSISSVLTILGDKLQHVPLWLFVLAPVLLAVSAYTALYIIISTFAPTPRLPTASEKTCQVVRTEGARVYVETEQLPCWYDSWAKTGKLEVPNKKIAEPVLLSIVIPAYNEEQRLPKMLEEAVEYLWNHKPYIGRKLHQAEGPLFKLTYYEILIISDGSTDKTVQVALDYAKDHPQIPIKVVELERNRGKGGAVTHGWRHARGERVLFADADGATKFSDVSKLEEAMDKLVENGDGRGVAIGSRAHLVGSEAVVKVCSLSLFLTPIINKLSDPGSGIS
jgi:dolichyl-phosphate beta-glucosyltransferase